MSTPPRSGEPQAKPAPPGLKEAGSKTETAKAASDRLGSWLLIAKVAGFGVGLLAAVYTAVVAGDDGAGHPRVTNLIGLAVIAFMFSLTAEETGRRPQSRRENTVSSTKSLELRDPLPCR